MGDALNCCYLQHHKISLSASKIQDQERWNCGTMPHCSRAVFNFSSTMCSSTTILFHWSLVGSAMRHKPDGVDKAKNMCAQMSPCWLLHRARRSGRKRPSERFQSLQVFPVAKFSFAGLSHRWRKKNAKSVRRRSQRQGALLSAKNSSLFLSKSTLIFLDLLRSS